VPGIERERLSTEEGGRRETGGGHAAGSGEASIGTSTDASTDSSLRVGFGDANMGRFRDRMQEQPSNDLLCSLLGCVFMAGDCIARSDFVPPCSRLACRFVDGVRDSDQFDGTHFAACGSSRDAL
jgi:hypothetical protein